MCVEPSSTELAPVTWTVGATLATVTVWLSAAPVSPSESFADAVTFGLAGPSAKRHWNEPAVSVFVSEPATFVPFAPQLVETDETVSAPGSEIV